MPAFLERKLKKEYGAKSAIPYKIMNSQGLMKGNKETAKGREMAAKHAHKMSGVPAGKKLSLGNLAKVHAK